MIGAKLVIEKESREFELGDGKTVIARPSPGERPPDVPIENDRLVHRKKHAVITRDEKGYYIQKVGKNPTKVNDREMEGVYLENGDKIQVGSTVIHFVCEDKDEVAIESETIVFQGDEQCPSFEKVQGDELDTGSELFRTTVLKREMDEVSVNRLQTLFAATSDLNPFLGEEDASKKTLGIIREVLDVDRCAILIRKPETDELEPKVIFDKSPSSKGAELLISRGILGEVMSKGMAVFASNVQADRHLRRRMSVILQNIKSVICVPLRVNNETIGVCYIDSTSRANFYSKDDLAFLGVLANALAKTIVNARLVKKVEEQAVIRSNLERYFSPKIAEELASGSSPVDLGGKERKVSVLFTDIRGFTSLSRKLSPSEVLSLLNEHFSYVADIIFGFEGTIDKYDGDSVMAFWGAPVPIEHASVRCVSAAIEIQKEMTTTIRKKSEAEGKIPINIGIGINTGIAIAGNIGSARRMDYSIVSDAVNLASRLCAIAEPEQILISEATYSEVKSYFQIRKLPPKEVKGIGEVSPFEVVYDS